MLLFFNSPIVSANWLKDNLDLQNLIILDATINKTIQQDSKCIPNARFFDIKQKFSDTTAAFPSTLPSKIQFEDEAQKLGINNNTIIVVYDDKGIYSSARAWWLFKTFGFDNIAVLDGGLPQWKLYKFQIENYSSQNYAKGDFIAKSKPQLMTNFKGINQYSNDKTYLILDARASNRFQCLVDEPRVGLRRGTIPNSKNLPYKALLSGYTLKPKVELEKLFKSVIDAEKHFVFTCGSGITACILALAATLCNLKTLTVYDGSWTEYGTLIPFTT